MTSAGTPEDWLRTFSRGFFSQMNCDVHSRTFSTHTCSQQQPPSPPLTWILWKIQPSEAGWNIFILLRRYRDSVYSTWTPVSAPITSNSLHHLCLSSTCAARLFHPEIFVLFLLFFIFVKSLWILQRMSCCASHRFPGLFVDFIPGGPAWRVSRNSGVISLLSDLYSRARSSTVRAGGILQSVSLMFSLKTLETPLCARIHLFFWQIACVQASHVFSRCFCAHVKCLVSDFSSNLL